MSLVEFEHACDVAGVLSKMMPGAVSRDVPLSELSFWKIGGRADLIVRPRSLAELCRLRAFLHAWAMPHLVIGATSNLLFSDEGLRVVCLQIGGDFANTRIEGAAITADPGVWVPGLAGWPCGTGWKGWPIPAGSPERWAGWCA